MTKSSIFSNLFVSQMSDLFSVFFSKFDFDYQSIFQFDFIPKLDFQFEFCFLI